VWLSPSPFAASMSDADRISESITFLSITAIHRQYT